MNSLTTDMGLRVGPTMLEVFVRHYFDRLKRDVREGKSTRLKEGDVLFDEAFTIVKAFLNASTQHTVEELQGFSNTRTPSPPWVHVVRSMVPMSCCEEASIYLIKALGGEDAARKIVGGIKWWQVRGVNGVDAQWITAKKDWQEAKRRHKMEKEQKAAEGPKPSTSASTEQGPSTADNGTYEKEMDAMRCILYLHGGGYYFGSVDQERYSIQRHARKINGRVFAINYRLAPQYPFPCALQDALAAYIFLIRPPPGAEHEPVKPAHIVIAGDSAGGGLSLALLQAIRDSDLPAPAGGILISPWCDLSHSFPSIHQNTATDIIPESGLSFHKPSILWPPPTPEVSTSVHASIRFRIRQTLRLDDPKRFNATSTIMHEKELQTPIVATDSHQEALSIPLTNSRDAQRVDVTMKDGTRVQVSEQFHFYAQNHLINHPLVSPAMSYLGGLPPLLFIEGDHEVLRDEGIYTAHKAASPSKFPISDKARELYPPLVGIEERYKDKPTSVHLQVYDDAPHVLPVLFSFATPSKFCFRAMASFVKFVTDMNFTSNPSPRATSPTLIRRASQIASVLRSNTMSQSPRIRKSHSADSAGTEKPNPRGSDEKLEKITTPPLTEEPHAITPPLATSSSTLHPSDTNTSLRRSLSARLSNSFLRRASSTNPSNSGSSNGHADIKEEVAGTAPQPPNASGTTSSDVAGPRFQVNAPPNISTARTAGESSVYAGITNRSQWECGMIRERVSTTGVVRALEPQDEIQALMVPHETVGQMTPDTMERYLKDKARFDKKFHRTIKNIDKHRKKNLQRAKEDTIKRLGLLQQILHRDESEGHPKKLKEKAMNGGAIPNWGWAWALDEHEAPPPSSIASRRDTDEAQQLAQIADQAILGDDKMLSANTLWGLVMSFLTVTPGKDSHVLKREDQAGPSKEDAAVDQGESSSSKVEDKKSIEAEGTTKRSLTTRISKMFHRNNYRQGASKSSVSVDVDPTATVKRKTSSHHHLPLPNCLKDGSHIVDNHGIVTSAANSSAADAPPSSISGLPQSQQVPLTTS